MTADSSGYGSPDAVDDEPRCEMHCAGNRLSVEWRKAPGVMSKA
jgi:hypothetical protein